MSRDFLKVKSQRTGRNATYRLHKSARRLTLSWPVRWAGTRGGGLGLTKNMTISIDLRGAAARLCPTMNILNVSETLSQADVDA